MKFSLQTKDDPGSEIISTAYFPPVTYVAKCLHAKEVLIEQFETYPKQTLRNRCFIYGPNGKQILSVPVTKPDGNRTRTREVRISYDQAWQRHHIRSILTAYNNSPYFLYYQDYFLPVLGKRFEFLIDLNCSILEKVSDILKLQTKIQLTDRFYQEISRNKDLQHYNRKDAPNRITEVPDYTQVFSPKHGFLPDLSIIDLIFNLGPESHSYLQLL